MRQGQSAHITQLGRRLGHKERPSGQRVREKRTRAECLEAQTTLTDMHLPGLAGKMERGEISS
jgi:hypothetical protein